ncbi:hypothetical protein L3X38_032944 [Prunus dulcis]|uniref:Integrase catalytic domain-containing protein n=1 Tax=Prunus dulcis TaxID=3755 RepID=A0AAD4YWC9_PRUDU|nr:hypothetical protein L3X38_032944 [Prunus dulcis]
MQIDEDPNWQDPIIDYLVNGNLPTDKSEARKVQHKVERYYMQGDKLIRRSYSGPHLTCIKYPQTFEVLCKIHDGECGNHSGGRSLAQKALNMAIFGLLCAMTPLNMSKDVIAANGPMPTAPAKKEMVIVATDYFTKWIEAEALSSTKEDDVERFIWRNIICRFGCPQSLVTDNGSQFIGKQITAFFKKSTGETPFSLAYGTETIIPPHITVPSIGIEVGSIEQNSEQMRLNLDLLEGEREKAIVRVASYQ